ncbi:hypothetical protein Dimus_000646 [Dionaea muscipula]
MSTLSCTQHEATKDAAKDVASPQKHKKRKLTKGGTAMATTSKAENIDHRKEAVATGSVVVEDKGKKVDVEPAKVDEANLTIAPQLPLAYATAKWTLLSHHSVLLAGTDKAAKKALRHEWTRGSMTAKDQSVCKNLDNVSFNQLMTQATVQDWDLALSTVGDFMLPGSDLSGAVESTKKEGISETLKEDTEVVEVPSGAVTAVEEVPQN